METLYFIRSERVIYDYDIYVCAVFGKDLKKKKNETEIHDDCARTYRLRFVSRPIVYGIRIEQTPVFFSRRFRSTFDGIRR